MDEKVLAAFKESDRAVRKLLGGRTDKQVRRRPGTAGTDQVFFFFFQMIAIAGILHCSELQLYYTIGQVGFVRSCYVPL